jgi:2-polyprenyl-3-methyl-5-hydroxy-6-metoxy-1,4-benzoquinol methylase
MKPHSLSPVYFESLYAKDSDPWQFATSEYERNKYAVTLAALAGRRIRSAFDVGCSIGIFTRQLAGCCQSVLAVDVADKALVLARRNCDGLSNVRFARMQIPQEWPADEFDLVVLSEVLYYFCPADIRRIAYKTLSTLLPGGAVLLVHWTGETNYPCSADRATKSFLAACGTSLNPLLFRRESEYRLDLLTKPA